MCILPKTEDFIGVVIIQLYSIILLISKYSMVLRTEITYREAVLWTSKECDTGIQMHGS